MVKRAWIRRCLAVVLLLAMAPPAWAEFVLPPLPYAPDALEPAIDATTMGIHHDRHHGAYAANLNGKIQAHPELAKLSLSALHGQISRPPAAVRTNGCCHWHDPQLWAVYAPPGELGEPAAGGSAGLQAPLGPFPA